MELNPLNGSVLPRNCLIREVASVDGQDDSTCGGIGAPLAISPSAGGAVISADVGPRLRAAAVTDAVAAKRLCQMDTMCNFLVIE